ncbi:winged helix-turn-helix transcriptional regulator [Amycolatopsis sp. H20-H5]|uniref:winged helix-turn-helix transcriptional regulator n=1 Tax=Amycolatopsis sp. H20-H5 TaxID=3046309 RepID=UPI002DB93A6C|nr:winged helix-turn-helix transcriptional regulator [Amycolatopsis sp. H20-H5]MEC3976922.1 winged helix-turn-helix transcriptional regulator [Amycolatopsis sp. H20-H5]
MTVRTYGQFCGVARALELVGERWSMLIIRDLLLGPKRFTDLRTGLPRIPASILSSRLNDMESSGVLRRRVLPQLDAAVVYELTEYGAELDQILLQLGLWGARSLGVPGQQDVFTLDSAILSLYTTFRAEAARNAHVSFELRYGPMVVHALVDGGALKVAEGSYPAADLVICSQASLVPLLTGEVSADQALRSGLVAIEGDPAHLELFTSLFHIPSAPKPSVGLAVH